MKCILCKMSVMVVTCITCLYKSPFKKELKDQRNQFKNTRCTWVTSLTWETINTFVQSYDYSLWFNKRKKTSIEWSYICKSLNLPQSGMLCAKFSCMKLAQWFWRRTYQNFVYVFPLFCYFLPLENGWTLYLNKLEFPSPKDVLCQVWLKLTLKKKMKVWKV